MHDERNRYRPPSTVARRLEGGGGKPVGFWFLMCWVALWPLVKLVNATLGSTRDLVEFSGSDWLWISIETGCFLSLVGEGKHAVWVFVVGLTYTSSFVLAHFMEGGTLGELRVAYFLLLVNDMTRFAYLLRLRRLQSRWARPVAT